MGLRDFFQGLFNTDPTRAWAAHVRGDVVLDLTLGTFNGHPLGVPLVEFDFNQAGTATRCGLWLA